MIFQWKKDILVVCSLNFVIFDAVMPKGMSDTSSITNAKISIKEFEMFLKLITFDKEAN